MFEGMSEPESAQTVMTTSAEHFLQMLPADVTEQQLAAVLVGLANAKGGTILIGRDGAPDVPAIERKLTQACLSCEPPLHIPPTRRVEFEGRQALSVSVPAELADVYSLNGRYWVRQGGRNRPLSGKPLQQLILERGLKGTASGAFESLPAPNATLNDLNWEQVRHYLATAQRGGGIEADRLSPDELAQFLMRLGGLVYKDGTPQPTYAGLLVFGLAPQQFLPSSEMVLVRYAGTQMSEEFLRENVRGPLPEQIRKAELFLLSNMRRGSRLVGWKREDEIEYPPEAVREAVVNAVAHRDYGIQGEGIRIIMFADRLEVYSPGRLPGHVTLENIVEERFSRNPVLVQLLVDLGFIESLGYGIDRMIALMESASLPRPVFQEMANGFKVTLYGQGENLVSDGADPSRWVHLNLNERQIRALSYLTENDRITNRVYQELCPDVSPETIRRDLVELVSRGLLLRIGDKKATYYIFK
jgi:ATP-dependent DNA helicase RecG